MSEVGERIARGVVFAEPCEGSLRDVGRTVATARPFLRYKGEGWSLVNYESDW
jgi:hypothetical protein